MKVWITKYALTTGIEERDVEWEASCPGMVTWLNESGYGMSSAHGNDWHRTKNEAMSRAETMRLLKITSLRKQIAKLEKLSFKH